MLSLFWCIVPNPWIVLNKIFVILNMMIIFMRCCYWQYNYDNSHGMYAASVITLIIVQLI